VASTRLVVKPPVMKKKKDLRMNKMMMKTNCQHHPQCSTFLYTTKRHNEMNYSVFYWTQEL